MPLDTLQLQQLLNELVHSPGNIPTGHSRAGEDLSKASQLQSLLQEANYILN